MASEARPLPMTLRWRGVWLKTHRWFALAIGWLLALQGLAGGVLVIARPIDEWLHPQLFKASAAVAEQATLESVRAALAASLGPGADFTFRPPRESDESMRVLVRGAWVGTVYVDPASGRELGRRGDDEGFVNVLFRGHSSLWLGDVGKATLAWIALSYLFMLVTGLILWWPRRWPPIVKLRLRSGAFAAFFDLHRTTGALLGLVIAMSVATGAWMAWRPLGEFVSYLAGEERHKPPVVPKGSSIGERLPLDTLLTTAQQRFPGAAVGYVQAPGRTDRPVRVRLIVDDDPHPNGLSSVWLHPVTGAVLGERRWNELDAGAAATAVIYPLHTGEIGGAALEAVVLVGGAALGLLGVSGVWLWWRRRKP